MVFKMFESIFTEAPIGIVLLRKSRKILFTNYSFEHMLGYTNKELYNIMIEDFIFEDDRKRVIEALDALSIGAVDKTSLEFRYMPVIGKSAWCNSNFSFTEGSNTEERIIVGFFEDITTRKIVEERLKSAKAIAERATKTKSDFLANMSHEIRTPIHTITGMTELLLNTSLDAEQQEYAEQIHFSADVLLSLINDILDFSKIEAGKLSLEMIDFDLYKAVDEGVGMVAMEAHRKELEAIVFIDKKVRQLLIGDPLRLRQIIVNLFKNAVKFTANGYIMLKVESVSEDNRFTVIKFSVEDTGIGIPEDKIKKLFQGFSQVDSSTTRKYGGTGLGLSISSNLTEQMGGKIGVESEYGKGSTFWFTAKFTKQKGENPYSIYNGDFSDSKVLVVDDNTNSRLVLVSYLLEWGCQVVEADNGEKALSLLKEGAETGDNFTFCFLDVFMPGMDGWHLASEINSDKTINSVNLFLMSPTGANVEEAKMKLLKWFDGYLSKPIKKGELFECLVNKMDSAFDLETLEEATLIDEVEDLSTVNFVDRTILIAEDHEVNQNLFRLILEGLGYNVILASNGVEAVNATEDKDFDLIFMDCQMPEKNGFEATIEIRNNGIKTPIVAVTASAIKGEKKKCLDCGMNDFLSKPFKQEDLVPVLEKWLPRKVSNSVEQTVTEPAANPESEIFNLENAVDTFVGRKDVVIKVLKSFIVKVEEQIQNIGKALETPDFDAVRSDAHSIKGGGLNLSVYQLGNIAASLEKAAVEKDEESCQKLFEELKTAYVAFCDYTANIL